MFIPYTLPIEYCRPATCRLAWPHREDKNRKRPHWKEITSMTKQNPTMQNRRGFLTQAASGILLFTSSAVFADQLLRTPQLTKGPYYPDRLPLDTDNDL